METNLQRPRSLFEIKAHYEIPDFQRRYMWKQEEQWEPLWDDVEALAQSTMDGEDEVGATKPHFMGAVVLQQESSAAGTVDRRIVVDGQQRLITLQLLIDAVREVLDDREHPDPAARLSNLVVNEEQFRGGNPDHAFKVWPTVVDRTEFRQAMSSQRAAADRAASTSRIMQAHAYFKGQAEQWLDRFQERDNAASALEAAVSDRLELVVINLGKSDNPHVIFETLNARGTPLLQSDMIKNRILHDAEVEPRDGDGEASGKEKRLWPFDDRWWTEEVGRGLQRRPRVDVYLNHWLTIRNLAETRPYDEFRVFGRYADDQKREGIEIKTVARDMGDLASIYRKVEKFQRADIAKFLERRDVMNLGVVTPLLLWLLEANLRPETLANCVKALESFLVRRVVCGYSARSYGELFVGLMAKLARKSAGNADSVLVKFLRKQGAQATLWPSDKELRKRFITAPLYQHLTRGRLRMVLAGIEQALRTNKAESQDVPRNLHVEHVMPQKWRTNWPLQDGIAGKKEKKAEANRDRAIHTIGNLTLVNCRLNASLSNARWEKKRATLADHSVLFLNKRLVRRGPEVWDEKAIKKRAKWLHTRAVRIWPHADDMNVG